MPKNMFQLHLSAEIELVELGRSAPNRRVSLDFGARPHYNLQRKVDFYGPPPNFHELYLSAQMKLVDVLGHYYSLNELVIPKNSFLGH